jgi:hypothetical protein
MLLTSSGIAGLFAFLPFVLLDVGLDSKIGWRIGSGLQVVWFVGIAIYRQRQAHRAGVNFFDKPGGRWMGPLLVVVIALQFLNVGWLGVFWPYMVGLIQQLAVGFWAIVLLILDTWPVGKTNEGSLPHED